MTTKTETEIKFKPLMNLTDANLVNQWWQNIKNVTRKHKVTDIDKEGKKIHMGNLFLLLSRPASSSTRTATCRTATMRSSTTRRSGPVSYTHLTLPTMLPV